MASLKRYARPLALLCLFMTGCHVARDAAVTTFRVVDAPAAYVRRRIDESEDRTTQTTTTTTTVTSDDVPNPGSPIIEPIPPPQSGRSTRQRSTPAAKPRRDSASSPETTARSAATSPPKRTAATPQAAQFPYAKPVPGKAGYVFSPFDPKGGYVDVSGYSPGSKVKDPYTGKIFLVP